MDEIKVRLAKVTKQLEDMQATQQSFAAQQATTQAQQQQMASAPPPDVLYNNGLRDYNGGKNDLATQEFSDYIKFYPNTDLAGNSYYYLGELQFKQANYQQAVQSYEQVLQNFPSGNKAASAQLKKGFALLELGKQDEGVSELRHLIQRYPHSPEALQAQAVDGDAVCQAVDDIFGELAEVVNALVAIVALAEDEVLAVAVGHRRAPLRRDGGSGRRRDARAGRFVQDFRWRVVE